MPLDPLPRWHNGDFRQEHIVRQEDIPLVSNFGLSFSLQPWNFFDLNAGSNPPEGEL